MINQINKSKYRQHKSALFFLNNKSENSIFRSRIPSLFQTDQEKAEKKLIYGLDKKRTDNMRAEFFAAPFSAYG